MVSIPAGPSIIAARDCAYGLARYAAIAQNAGLVSSGVAAKAEGNGTCKLCLRQHQLTVHHAQLPDFPSHHTPCPGAHRGA